MHCHKSEDNKRILYDLLESDDRAIVRPTVICRMTQNPETLAIFLSHEAIEADGKEEIYDKTTNLKSQEAIFLYLTYDAIKNLLDKKMLFQKSFL